MMHWTQRPENKAKVEAMRVKAVASRKANAKKKLKETTKRLTPRPYNKKVKVAPATMIGTAMRNVSDFFGGLTANEIVNLRNESPELISQIKKIKQLLECF